MPTRIVLFVIACLIIGACTPAGDSPPSIVLILADDLGFGDLGSYNPDSRIPTPNLDRLAAEGIRFTDAHSPSSVCTPTRYGIITGQYGWRTRLKRGVLHGYSPNLIDTSRTTVASLLQDNGYTTAVIGKWHLGLGDSEPVDYGRPLSPGPRDHGFDYFFGIPASLDMTPYVYVENEYVLALPTDSIGPGSESYESGGPFWRGGPIAPGFQHIDVHPRLTEKAVEFIESSTGKPFFLYLPLASPHTPWLPTAAFSGVSQAGDYGDFTAMVDATVGEVMAALERIGQSERTLIIFTSDNGSYWPAGFIEQYEHRSNGNWRGMKADIWESGHRVPFVARWPDVIPAGRTTDHLLSLTDLMATFAAAAGITLPENGAEDSINMLPALRGDEGTIRTSIIHHSVNGVFAIREGPWKLIEGLGSGGFTTPSTEPATPNGPIGQLYNLVDDPGETRNRYLEEPDVVARLTALLDTQRSAGRTRQ
jgi:arylsulfatase A